MAEDSVLGMTVFGLNNCLFCGHHDMTEKHKTTYHDNHYDAQYKCAHCQAVLCLNVEPDNFHQVWIKNTRTET